jgi:DNA-binding MurR/RpiR family transcriptional regulator
MKRTSHQNGKPLPVATREQLRDLVARDGQYEVAKRLGVSAPTIARALGGLGLRGVSHTALTASLSQITTAEKAA